MKKFSMGRRRTLKILAVAGGSLAALRAALVSGATANVFSWHGNALGAKASLALYHVSDVEGRRLVRRITGEIQRLEMIFSLYRADSAVTKLNADGFIDNPPLDLLRLLSEARAVSELTEGAFDVTVQPLWLTHAAYYRTGNNPSAGSFADESATALELVGYQGIDINSRAIRLNKPGMAITLNGIAQGYITDRIADMLYAEGLKNVLINLGEIRAMDTHPSGRPWAVGLQDPVRPGSVTDVIAIQNQAVATSAGAGTRFDGTGIHHPIFDPRSGRSATLYSSLSVVGKYATVADALSTGLYNMQPRRARAVLNGFPGYRAYVVYANGRKQAWPGSG